MTAPVSFLLDGQAVTANPGESIFRAAVRAGIELPHMCSEMNPHYRADGNCRLCLVEIEGERTLAPSCLRTPTDGMKVSTASARAEKARRMVMELLLADHPDRAQSHDADARFWQMADHMGVDESRFPARKAPPPAADRSHPAIAVHLDACIQCTNCVRACREVQVNDVIGMSHRGAASTITFDLGDDLNASTCVACGECVQACPTGALMPASALNHAGQKTETADRTVHSLCPYCGVGCQLTYHVAGNRILYADGRDGPANQNRLCVKGRFGFDYTASPERLTTPLIRRADAPKDPTERLDPANPLTHFREATWEEALDRAAQGLAAIRDAHGPGALAGFGSAKGSNEEAYLFQKLVRTGFGTNNVDHCTRLCHASSVAALMEGIGSGAVTAPFTAAEQSDVIIVIGASPTQNHPVAATFIKNAKKTGKTLIVMDPRGQGLTRHADYMLQFNGGADVALLNSILHVIVEEGLTDETYIARFTQDADAVKARVRDYAPEKMEPVTGIAPDVVRAVARTYATAERGLIFWGMGVSQHTNGTDNVRALIALATLTGNVGRPGTGLHPLRGQNNVQGASDMGLIPMVLPDYKSIADATQRQRFEDAWGARLDPKPGLTVVEILDAAHAGHIRGMYVMGENPAMSDPDAGHAREGLARLDHLVVQDIFLTETAYLADVILPATSFYEKTGTFTNTNRQVQLARAIVSPPGAARPDLDLIQEMARRMGLNWNYPHPKDVFGEMRGLMASIAGISWDRLEREESVTYPCASEDLPGQDILFGDGFPTPDGKAHLKPVDANPPDEVPDADYPFILTTGRQLEHWHTGAITRRASVLAAIEPEATASIHPDLLRTLGIAPGEKVRVASRRGEIELIARADTAVPNGTVFVPFCYEGAAANLLTNPKLDPWGKIPEFKFCAVRMEKAD